MFVSILIALISLDLFQKVVVTGAGWHSGPTVNVVLGVTAGRTATEFYGAVFNRTVFGPAIYHIPNIDNIQSYSLENFGALILDVAVSVDGSSLCAVGAGFIYYGGIETVISSNWVNSIAFSSSISVEPLGSSGFAVIGQFNPPSPNYDDMLNGVAYSVDGTNWQISSINLGEDYLARYGAFPSVSTWYVTSGTWPNNNQGYTTGRVRVSGRLGILFNQNGHPQVNFISCRNIKGQFPGAISKTTNGGQTWAKILDSNGRYYFNQISCIDEYSCFTVAEDCKSAVVLATTDGGSTWDLKMSLSGPFSLNAVEMLSASEIWVTGGTVSSGPYAEKEWVGNYYHSIDGGNSWQTTSYNGYGYDISFKDEIGYASALFTDHTDIWIYQ